MKLKKNTEILAKVHFTFAILVFSLPALYSQELRNLSGQVADTNNKPIDGAIVSLVQARSSSLIKTLFTETNGTFEFTGLKTDSVILFINQAGYKKYVSGLIVLNGNKPAQLVNPIRLEEESKKMDEVVVTGKIPFVERKIDRTIVNPEALISNAGGNALDVLSKSPGVMVDQNGEIKLKGKSGVMIYVDDKPINLTGTELDAYLRSLPSNAIKQIELMTNPPANYGAAGNSGIINIKTKKTKIKGLNGNLSLNYAQGRYARTLNNFSLNYATKKIAFFSGLSGSIQNRFQDLTIYRRYKNEDLSTKSIFTQRTYIKIGAESYSARLGLDYYLNTKTTFGVSVKGSLNPSSVSKYNSARLLNADQSLNRTVIADNSETNLFKNGTANLNLRHQFDSAGKQITVDLDYAAYSTNLKQTFKNYVYLPDGTNAYMDTQTGSLPSHISIYALKSDYSRPLRKNSKLDAGLKSSYTKTDNDAVYFKTINSFTEKNYDLSNHFLYDELINAAYLNYSKSFSRIDLQAGLRAESTNLTAKQLGNAAKPGSSFNRAYANLFPTFYFSYKIDSAANNVLVFSYGKRIDRAFYKDLNPFVSPLDMYTFYSGNPYIKPTFSHNVSLAHSYKSFLTSTFSYNNTKDQIQETIEINNGIYYSRPGNIGSGQLFNLSVDAYLPLAKWLTTTIYSEVVYSEYKSRLYTETLNARGTYWFISGTNSFALEKGWSAEISGQYLTNFIDSQFSFGDFGFATLGFQKKLFKDKGSLKFSVSDVFYTNRIRGRINYLQLTDASWRSTTDSRVASLTFSYRFGMNTNAKPKYNANGSESEQKRVKS